jgi:ATP-binding cassette subfamily F protein uup
MNIFSLEGVSKGFGSGPLLEEVTFGLEHDEKMGLIGRNGSGKTTLLRLIAGLEEPDSGRVVRATGKVIGFVPQNPVFTAGQTVLDAMFDGGSPEIRRLHDYEAAVQELEETGGENARLLARVAELGHQLDETGGWSLEANAKAVLHRLGVTAVRQSVEQLSGGQRKRLALARGLVLRPDVLILDEPTNHLDADTIAWLEEYLAGYVGALLLVTHDRYFLDRVTGQMLEIERGRVQRYDGNYTVFLEKKEEQTRRRESEAVKRENLIRRELAWLRQGAKARSTKQKAHVDRARALLAQPKDGPDKTVEMAGLSSRLGQKILELTDITKAFDGRNLFSDFSLRLKRGDRIGLIGPNGSGKTTLLEIISGRLLPDAGTVETGTTTVIGYFDQESRALANDERIIDYIKRVAENVRTADGQVISASQMLERFLFPPAAQFTPVGRLSGGERRRLYLLRLLMGAPNVLLLDEPTNDLDIATLMALEEYLESFPGCLIVASHDRAFLDRTIDQLYRIEENGSIRGYPGNYTTFKEIRDQEAAEKAAAEAFQAASRKTRANRPTPSGKSLEAGNPENRGNANLAPAASPRKLTFKERRELEELETVIAVAETRKVQIETLLEAGSPDYAAVVALSSELQALVTRLDTDMARWAELAEIAG